MTVVLLDLTIDLARRAVARNGEALPVHGLSFDLLAYMLGQGTRVVAADELMNAVWHPAVVNEETVTQRVKLLRQALGDDSRRPRYLRTVRGRGYHLCAAAAVIDQPSDTTEADLPEAQGWSPSSASGLAGLALLMALALLAALWWPPPPATSSAAIASSEADAQALAERARHYASIGQRDDTLRAIDLYRQALQQTPADPQLMLGLSFVSSAMMCLHNEGEQRALEAQRLAQQVLDANPNDAAAYAARGYAADCRGLIDQAIADYRQALRLDPQGRADSLASLAHLLAVRGHLAEALAANLRARHQGHQLRFVDLQLAGNLELLGYPAAAERLLAANFTLYPDNMFVAVAWPRFLYYQGRLDEAAAALSQSMSRPQHPNLWLLAGEMAMDRDDQEGACAAFERAAELKPGNGSAATLVQICRGSLDAEFATKRLADLNDALAHGDRWPDNWLEMAQIQWVLGNVQQALEALGHAVDEGFRDRTQLQRSPLWQGLSETPGFGELLQRMAIAIAKERKAALDVPGLAELLGEGLH